MMAPIALTVRKLSREGFAPFGEVIDIDGAETRMINQGTTTRFHALATATVDMYGAVIVNLFRAEPRLLPYDVDMMERHPLGSQAFYPLSGTPWLVVAAADAGGVPGAPQVFLAGGAQGVNYRANVWHHPLITLDGISDFLVIDRGGPGDNLEECSYPRPYRIDAETIEATQENQR